MELRNDNINRLGNEEFDALVIGGGINGSVSAAALAARGLKVALIDARDFAGFTSQHSSNLVWGGIKYMEGYEFGLVAGLCKSRNELLDSFPSTVKEIRFLMTINRQFRFHPLVILASTWLYWLLGRGKTRIPHLLSLRQIKHLEPLVNTYVSTAGVEYSDAFLHDNDARFVFNFVRSAMDKGCVAANYVASRLRRSKTRSAAIASASAQKCWSTLQGHSSISITNSPASAPSTTTCYRKAFTCWCREFPRAIACWLSSPTTSACSSRSRWPTAPASALPIPASRRHLSTSPTRTANSC
jgi:glycerol-3-phosphate dehydrogenase